MDDKELADFDNAQEKQALEIIGSEDNAEKVAEIYQETFASLSEKSEEQPLNEWVEDELAKHPDVFPSAQERKQTADEIIESLKSYNRNRAELEETVGQGKTPESWLVKKIEESAAISHADNIGAYAHNVDEHLKQVNENFLKYSQYSADHKTHGLVAEDMANLSDAVKNSEVIHAGTNNAKNGADRIVNGIEIQTKYYDTPTATVNSAFEKGQYKYIGSDNRPMQLEVPKDQYETAIKTMEIKIQEGKVAGVTDPAKAKELIRSGELTYDESIQQAKELKKQKDFQELNWDKLGKTEIAKSMVAETGKTMLFHSVFQGGRIAGRRLWNKMTGKKNQEPNRDVQEWLDGSYQGAKSIAVQTAATTAATIAVRKGLIDAIPKGTPAGMIANIVYVGIENTKVLYKMAKGEISVKEGMWKMHEVTISATNGIAGSMIGAEAGAAYGLALGGPVGAVVGGLVGGIVGGLAGSTYGQVIAKGTRKVVEVATAGLKKAYAGVKSVAKSAWKTFTGLFA
ncbi:MAG: hypothetical protein WCW84_05300 [Sulfurimonas sp.]|jgi:hypothetical protein